MNVEKVVVGLLQENCYILDIDGNVMVVDPGDEYEKIIKVVGNRNIVGILITHSHFDHIGAVSCFNNVPVYKFDNLEEKEYIINDFKFDVIFNPGHSLDSVSYYFKDNNVLFCGDFIFYHSIGRCDLDGGNFDLMIKSIEKIKRLDNNIIIYPGHGISTTLKEEIKNNEYFNY